MNITQLASFGLMLGGLRSATRRSRSSYALSSRRREKQKPAEPVDRSDIVKDPNMVYHEYEGIISPKIFLSYLKFFESELIEQFSNEPVSYEIGYFLRNRKQTEQFMMDGDTKAVIKPGSIDDLFGETFQANRANWLIDDFKIVYQVQEQDVTVTVEYDAETDLADELHITVEGDNDFAESLRKKLKDTDFQLKGLPSPKEGTIMIDDWYGEYNSPFY